MQSLHIIIVQLSAHAVIAHYHCDHYALYACSLLNYIIIIIIIDVCIVVVIVMIPRPANPRISRYGASLENLGRPSSVVEDKQSLCICMYNLYIYIYTCICIYVYLYIYVKRGQY